MQSQFFSVYKLNNFPGNCSSLAVLETISSGMRCSLLAGSGSEAS